MYLFYLVIWLVLFAMPVQAARYALVIGNENYSYVSSLHNPRADAQDMAAILKSPAFGFKVTRVLDGDLRSMQTAVDAFIAKLRQTDDALVYYSGHGIQYNGANYLVPVDADPKTGADVPYTMVNAQRILDNLQEVNSDGVNLLILDACRNSPFKSIRKGTAPGLANMKPKGSLVLYATAPDTFAQGNEKLRNSIYTYHLLRVLSDPANYRSSIYDVQTQIAASVSADTGRSQLPWQEGMLTHTFCFVQPCQVGIDSNELERLRRENQRLQDKLAQQSVLEVPPNPEPPTPDCAYCPEMVDIPAGSFMMGSPEGTGESYEHPQHEVTVAAFSIGIYEVTQGQWRAVMGSNPSYFSSCGDNCPVERVSWDDVQEYIKKLNAKTGKTYRLPSESEWEYACRGGIAGDTYCGGNDIDAVAWHYGNSGSKTHPVGGKAANGFGLFDMSGNVWEWNQDKWHNNYNGATTNGGAWETGDNDDRLLRGCSWNNSPVRCRSAARNDNANPSYDLGFRVVLAAAGRGF